MTELEHGPNIQQSARNELAKWDPKENLVALSLGVFGATAVISMPLVHEVLREYAKTVWYPLHGLVTLADCAFVLVPFLVLLVCSPLPTLVMYWRAKNAGSADHIDSYRRTPMPAAVCNFWEMFARNVEAYRSSKSRRRLPVSSSMPGLSEQEAAEIIRYGWVSWNGFIVTAMGIAIALPISFLLRVFAHPENLVLLADLCLVLIVPISIAPLVMLWAARRRLRNRQLSRSSAMLPRGRVKRTANALKRACEDRATKLVLEELPFVSAYSAFVISAIAFVAAPYLPQGGTLGMAIASWLLASTNDANLPMTSVPWFSTAVTGVLLVAILWGLTPLAVRFSAFYQLFLQKLALSNAGGGIIEAFSETLRVPSTKLKLAPAHPHLQSFAESLVWIAFCYVALFCLVAFSSGAIEAAILNIFYFAFLDAGLLLPDLNMFCGPVRLFLASVVAAFGTAPFGLMACTFLPNRAPKEVLLSQQGILVPQEFAMGGLAPIRLWKDLRKIKIIGAGKNRRDRSMKLTFHLTGSFTIPFRLLSVEQVSELFATIEEHAVDCKVDDKTAAFRAEIAADCPSKSSEVKAFTSTIFKPHAAGFSVIGGSYRIVRLIASKPLTAVYLARSPDDKLVVVKQLVMPRDDGASKKLKDTLRREYETLKRLNHPMIAKVLDIADDDRGCYLVIEHIRGEDLRSLVTRCGARSIKIVREWATELCRQMRYLHSQDPPLIHRDLSPDNIMLAEDGSIRIIDFGAAHQFMEGVTGTLIGKQCYIAPEQLRGRADIRSDIYSFGCTLFFLVAGKDPAALRQCDPIELGIKIPADLNEVIRRCTDFEESARPRSFEEVELLLSDEVLCID